MKTTLDIDLAAILSQKHASGYRVPVHLRPSTLVEYGDEDWQHELDLDALLEADRKLALVLSADAVQALRPHLTDEQAWEVASATRDQVQGLLEGFLTAEADDRFPRGRCLLQTHLATLKSLLDAHCKTTHAAPQLRYEVAGVERLLEKLPATIEHHPLLEEALAATLDDIERAIAAGSTSNAEIQP